MQENDPLGTAVVSVKTEALGLGVGAKWSPAGGIFLQRKEVVRRGEREMEFSCGYKEK